MPGKFTRRGLLAAAAATTAAASIQAAPPNIEKPAILGGKPVRTAAFPSWPVFGEIEEQALLKTVRSGKWFRGYGRNFTRFEEAFAELMGSKFCISTNSGTSALIIAMAALGVEAGDEVILPPYTFVACPNAILMLNALPVFVDTDPKTFQIDRHKLEAAITDRTRAIMPVHLGGSAADMDAILAVAAKHKIAVVEDACQAHLAEWRGKKLGTLGDAGCFSFQASKNMTCGEGGAIVTNSEEVVDRCFAMHSNGRNRKAGPPQADERGGNFRLTEFQAAILLSQMTRIEDQARIRTENAKYLTAMLGEIPGIVPAKLNDGCTRNAYHLYMFRYLKESFGGLSRASFLKAMLAEGIPVSAGYSPLNKQPFLTSTFRSRSYQKLFSTQRLAQWEQSNNCPENDRLCEEGAWLTQNILLGTRQDMEQIAEAVRKIQAHAGDLARA